MNHRILAHLVVALILVAYLAVVACSPSTDPTPSLAQKPRPRATPLSTVESIHLQRWTAEYLAAASMGVAENVSSAIIGSDPVANASLSCAAMFTADAGLQELRVLAWREARSFPGGAGDTVAAANYATMRYPDVCFHDADVHRRAFGSSPYITEPLGETPPLPTATPTSTSSFTATDDPWRECLNDGQQVYFFQNILLYINDLLDLDKRFRELAREAEPEDEGWVNNMSEVLHGFTATANGLLDRPVPGGFERFLAVTDIARLSASSLLVAAEGFESSIRDLDADAASAAQLSMKQTADSLARLSEAFMAVCDE